MKFAFFGSIILGVVITLIVLMGSGEGTSPSSSASGDITPQIVNGTQMIDIAARGGYRPKITQAKANVATVIRMKTQSTFDCSSALVIPDLNYSATLPATGVTEIHVPPQQVGTTLRGLCSMGMYSFSIVFS